jgi:hypothetical protein
MRKNKKANQSTDSQTNNFFGPYSLDLDNYTLYIYESDLLNSDIEEVEHFLEPKMSFNKALSECERLGDDWRLPSIDELEVMYQELFLKNKGNFESEIYWSNEDDGFSGSAFYFGKPGSFKNGAGPGERHSSHYFEVKNHVRPVRGEKPKELEEIPDKKENNKNNKIPGRKVKCRKCGKEFSTTIVLGAARCVCGNLIKILKAP